MNWPGGAKTVGPSVLAVSAVLSAQPLRSAQGVELGGELRQWHKVTLTFDGPQADERAMDPNPQRTSGAETGAGDIDASLWTSFAPITSHSGR